MLNLLALAFVFTGLHLAVVLVANKPNIVSPTGKQGNADVSRSSRSPKGVNTPRIGALAKELPNNKSPNNRVS